VRASEFITKVIFYSKRRRKFQTPIVALQKCIAWPVQQH